MAIFDAIPANLLSQAVLFFVLGLTATPKRQENADTCRYFGEPVFIYSLKEGTNDGFLTPFKVKQIQTTLDTCYYTPDDTVVEGEIEERKLYEEPDFNRSIEIRERGRKRVEIIMAQMDQNEKTLVFCATQSHALLVRMSMQLKNLSRLSVSDREKIQKQAQTIRTMCSSKS